MPWTSRLLAAALIATCAAPVAGHEQGPPDPPSLPAMLAGVQYLYGSAEAAAVTRETWRALVGYVGDAMKAKGNDRKSVVMTPDSKLQDPHFVPCGDKPPAAVFDVDETILLNLGFEYDTLVANRTVFDDDVWKHWEQTGFHDVSPTPGAKEALDQLRAMGVTVIFNTNRNGFDAKQDEAALNDAGVGPAVHGQTLFLAGDDANGSLKDGRRQMIAAKYCVLAMAGDQLVDLSDRFDLDSLSVAERRSFAALPAVAALWGNGWFVMPNPAYGSALQGGADDIFPRNKQWRDPGAAAPAPASPATHAAPPARHRKAGRRSVRHSRV
jgi:5'-nucleotidase (lipoprotein e(P4) family)